jgi:uncharacterized phage protein (TIGR01671 family)
LKSAIVEITRDIEFRAWNTRKKKMYPVDGFTCNWDRSFLTNIGRLIIRSTDKLMQYTGIKDCTEKKIFEDDILSFVGTKYKYIVKYENSY